MTTPVADRLRIGFWNWGAEHSTATDPVLVQKKTERALPVLLRLLEERHVDWLGLAEVGPISAGILRNELPAAFEHRFVTEAMPRTRWDLGAIWRTDRFTAASAPRLIFTDHVVSCRVAARFTTMETRSRQTLKIFVSHWASKLANAERRREAQGEDLRRAARETLQELADNEHVVLMGDYNLEPTQFATLTNSSRDRSLARKKPQDYLYAPFFRHYGTSGEAPESARDVDPCGTYHYSESFEDATRGRLYDHVVVSASLLAPARGWRLLEAETGPVREAFGTTAAPPKGIDHVPVRITLGWQDG